MQPTRWVVAEDGVHLAAYDLGGTGPPLLLLHANGFHALAYLPMVTHLRSAFHCWAYDMRGHGRSALGGGDCWARFDADMLAVIRALRIEGGYVFGHSMGGAVALAAAGAEPGLVAGLLVYEPVLCSQQLMESMGVLSSSMALAAAAQRRRAAFPSRAAAAERLSVRPPFRGMPRAALDAYLGNGMRDVGPQPGGAVELRCAPETEAALFRSLAAYAAREWFPRLPSIACRAIVAAGGSGGSNGDAGGGQGGAHAGGNSTSSGDARGGQGSTHGQGSWPAPESVGRDLQQQTRALGRHDWLQEASKEVAGAIPSARHIAFPNLDHFGPFMAPAVVAEQVMRLLRPGEIEAA